MFEFLRTSGPLFILAGSVISHRSDGYFRLTVSPLLPRVKVSAGSISISAFPISFSLPDTFSISLATVAHLLRLSERRFSAQITIVPLVSFLSRIHRWWRCSFVWSGLKKKNGKNVNMKYHIIKIDYIYNGNIPAYVSLDHRATSLWTRFCND